MSCRTGPLRAGRSRRLRQNLRDVYTGRGATISCEPSVGRQGILFPTNGRATRSSKKACERPRPAQGARPAGHVLSLEEVLGQEEDVGGTLGEATHEVGVPLGAEGDVDADAVALLDKPALEVAADAVEHLE